MKKVLAAVALSTVSLSAFAGGNLDVLGNYYSKSTESAAGAKTTLGTLKTERARLNFTGKVADGVTAKANVNLLTTATNGSAVQFLEMNHVWSEGLLFSVGKLDNMGYGGFEGLRAPADHYFSSLNHKRGYKPGAMWDYTLMDGQTLKVVFMNENEDDGSGSKTQTGYGLQWAGSFGENSKVLVSYHAVPNGAITMKYTAAGYQYKAESFTASLDYLMYDSGATAANKTNSAVLMVDVPMGNWIPQFKYEASTSDIAGTMGLSTVAAGNTGSHKAMSLGTEYKPNPADPFRYHFQYVSKASNSGATGANDDKSTEIFAGVRMLADFMK